MLFYMALPNGWDLVAEGIHSSGWSPECVRAEWLDADKGPRVGARFVGHNRNEKFEWQAVCEVTECARPHRFGWVVSTTPRIQTGPRRGGAMSWSRSPDGRTLVREWFEHDPGESMLRILLRERPELDARAVVELRRQRLKENMTATMAMMARAAGAPG